MIPWGEQFDELQGRVVFGANKNTLEWQLGTEIPAQLPDQIIEALELGEEAADVEGGLELELRPP